MKKTYILIIIIAVVVSIIVAFLPDKNNTQDFEPQKMLQEILDETRFVSIDEVAQSIVEQNKYILLIDVRTPEEYAEWTLPGALNIPFDSLLNKNYSYLLNQDVYKNVFFSNGGVYANQAWMLTRRMGYKNNYVMKGGLNLFFDEIIFLKYPDITDPIEAEHLYQFRKGVRQYFTGSEGTPASDAPAIEINIENRTHTNEDVGGC